MQGTPYPFLCFFGKLSWFMRQENKKMKKTSWGEKKNKMMTIFLVFFSFFWVCETTVEKEDFFFSFLKKNCEKKKGEWESKEENIQMKNRKG